ncbi:hypothetical protein FGO68_gene699 [Halteria grandinella]|uniref:Uncharacterized protein n=1 Tax=Halteria grandinella TaxID=5974 RepID=A0A8J8NVX5_HALGN|nr:hypothetical protein FGO68_gene699 [Halteria grandinella]
MRQYKPISGDYGRMSNLRQSQAMLKRCLLCSNNMNSINKFPAVKQKNQTNNMTNPKQFAEEEAYFCKISNRDSMMSTTSNTK